LTLDEFLRSGQYLPPFLRDFHAQKDVFKAIGTKVHAKAEAAQAAGEYDADTYDLDWRQTHVYTIDFFLWFMAMHGYTLQKTRARVPHREMSELIAWGKWQPPPPAPDGQKPSYRDMHRA
jgi:hypothetical protein